MGVTTLSEYNHTFHNDFVLKNVKTFVKIKKLKKNPRKKHCITAFVQYSVSI